MWDSQFVTWTEAFNNGHPFLSPLGQTNIQELLNWPSEMQDCGSVDPVLRNNYERVRYYINAIIADRCIAYLVGSDKVREYERWEAEQQRK